jgi:hypothetical protein
MRLDEASADALKALLGLRRHPEGGFYAQTFRSALSVDSSDHGGGRRGSTAIYYLLERGDFSALHRVSSDEVWHHYLGASVTLHVIDPAGVSSSQVLGKRLLLGERPQLVVPRGHWQAAVVLPARTESFALCGCTVAPGFEFEDFELADRDQLCRAFPEHSGLITELTR